MADYESVFTGLTIYGLAMLLLKAWFITALGQSLYFQCEFSSAAMRHSIWMATVLGLFTLPLLTLLLPSWSIPVFSVDMALVSFSAQGSGGAGGELPLYVLLVGAAIVVYWSVVVLYLLRLVVSLIDITRITFRARSATDQWQQLAVSMQPRCRCRIKISEQVRTPLTWGFLSPVILLPERSQYWTRQDREMVLQHEFSHIRRADWLMQLLAQIARALYWPIPGVHRALERLSLEAEQACDDSVLGKGIDAADYAHLLIRQAKINRQQTAVGLSQPSELGLRVRHIISTTINRAGERRMKYLLLILAALLMLPYASFQTAASLPHGRVLIVPTEVQELSRGRPEMAEFVPREYDPIRKPTRPEEVVIPPIPSINRDDFNTTLPAANTVRLETVMMEADWKEVEDIVFSSVKKLASPLPDYPIAAVKRGIEGRVVVEFDIDDTGSVHQAQVVYSRPANVFDKSVLEAIGRYRFEPYQINGKALSISGLIEEFNFKLLSE